VCSVLYQFLPLEKRFTNDATYKWKVILFGEKLGNHAAGRKHTVSEALAKFKNKISSHV
jgi:hypothetical protein